MKLSKLFALIAALDEEHRLVAVESAPLASPGEFERERDVLSQLPGASVIGRNWSRPAGTVASVAFPVHREVLADPETGGREAVVTGEVEVIARIDDDGAWEKLLEGVFVGLSIGERGAGDLDGEGLRQDVARQILAKWKE